MNENHYSAAQWQLLDDEIQKRFRVLAAQILALAPRSNPRFGKTVTKVFPLFSHVSFQLNPADDIDIIVGIDIAQHEGQWQIIADITEEESGTIHFELPNTPFSVSSFEELKNRVLSSTEQMINRGTPVLLRLLGSLALVVPSQAASMLEVVPQS